MKGESSAVSKAANNWSRLVAEGLVTDGDTNTKLPFKKMSKAYGLAYIEYLQAAWQANAGCLTEEEFCRVNGGVPKGFFDKKVNCG